jgi:hypothetical protein
MSLFRLLTDFDGRIGLSALLARQRAGGADAVAIQHGAPHCRPACRPRSSPSPSLRPVSLGCTGGQARHRSRQHAAVRHPAGLRDRAAGPAEAFLTSYVWGRRSRRSRCLPGSSPSSISACCRAAHDDERVAEAAAMLKRRHDHSSTTLLAFDPTDPVALTQALVRCPSVTPEEGGALAAREAVLSAAWLQRAAAGLQREPGTPDVENLYARIGTEGPGLRHRRPHRCRAGRRRRGLDARSLRRRDRRRHPLWARRLRHEGRPRRDGRRRACATGATTRGARLDRLPDHRR